MDGTTSLLPQERCTSQRKPWCVTRCGATPRGQEDLQEPLYSLEPIFDKNIKGVPTCPRDCGDTPSSFHKTLPGPSGPELLPLSQDASAQHLGPGWHCPDLVSLQQKCSVCVCTRQEAEYSVEEPDRFQVKTPCLSHPTSQSPACCHPKFRATLIYLKGVFKDH